jgi:membrane-associated phospholipid phosphatase
MTRSVSVRSQRLRAHAQGLWFSDKGGEHAMLQGDVTRHRGSSLTSEASLHDGHGWAGAGTPSGAFELHGAPLIVAALLALTATHKPLRIEHLVLALLLTALAWWTPGSRRFAWAALPFPVGGLLYENFELLRPLRGAVHVADLYRAEHALFAVQGQIPAHWWQTHTNPVLDAITGAAYALYLPWVFVIALILYFRDTERMQQLAWGFLVSNLIGMTLWLVYAAAPPWYVSQHGLGPASDHAVSSAAGALRFDALFGIHYFADFYTRSTNVFGAMPSLHVAYPTLAVFASWRLGTAYRVTTSLFVAVVAFSAIYLDHHYVLDVFAGLAVACLTQQIVVRARAFTPDGPAKPVVQPCA